MRRLFRRLFFLGFVLLLLIQLIPVWLWQTNPPVRAEPAWPNPETRVLAQRACFDCHSNETRWPLYSRLAPMSWLVTYDVLRGRDELNFSEWDGEDEDRSGRGDGDEDRDRGGRGRDEDDLTEVIREGEMPPGNYLLLHPEARLTSAEQQQLIEGLQTLDR